MVSFTKEPLHANDIVVYLKNERTGSSTIRKCKFIGQITGFTASKVEIMRLSPPDIFVAPEECRQLGTDKVYPDEVIQILNSRYKFDNWLPFPFIIGDLEFYTKEELMDWIDATRKEHDKLLE